MVNATLDSIERFLSNYYGDELELLKLNYPTQKSLIIQYMDFDRHSVELARQLLDKPTEILELLKEALYNKVGCTDVYPRIVSIPYRMTIRDIRNEHIGKFLAFDGMALKTTEVRPKLKLAAFECVKCGHINYIEQYNPKKLTEPSDCEGCHRTSKFILLDDDSKFTNSQRLRLQESLEELQGGDMPRTKDVELDGDLCGIISPGDRVVVNGILRTSLRITSKGKTPTYDVYIEANSIEKLEKVFEELKITADDEENIKALSQSPTLYEDLVKAIAPAVYGYSEIKEALLMQLFGGVQKQELNMNIRGDIHILLVGDPGVAKSTLAFFMSKLAPRSLYTSGDRSSAAGLTAAAVKDEFSDGAWSLEAGALVLADRGLAIVDEMDKMSKEDRNSLHQAMEHQFVSIAKAGIIATLNTRCALLGVANPIGGRFSLYDPLGVQINMPPTLLSRFDLIFFVTDSQDSETDANISSHVLKLYSHADTVAPETIDLELIRKYIAYAKRNVAPENTEEADALFQDFYVKMRKKARESEDAPIPITVRQLQSIIRLGAARARARLSDIVTGDDAMQAISLYEYCLRGVFTDPESGAIDVDRVVTSMPKTTRDRASSIRNIMRDLEGDFGPDIPALEVIKIAQDNGIDPEKAEKVLEAMKRDGILFSPSSGVVRFVR